MSIEQSFPASALGIVPPLGAETRDRFVLLFRIARLRFMRLGGNEVNRATPKI